MARFLVPSRRSLPLLKTLTPSSPSRPFLTDPRPAAFDENLLRILRAETTYLTDYRPPYSPPPSFGQFSIEDRPGEQWVRLRTRHARAGSGKDEDVKVEATMFDGAAPIPFYSFKSSLASPRGPARTDGDKGVMVGAPFRIPKILLPNCFTYLRRLVSRRPDSTTPSGPTNPGKMPASVPVTAAGEAEGGGGREDAYKQLQNLDFMTAAKILFTTPPRKKKFGLDFHLVQLFFTCLPSLAVYLVAQYARHEIRRMEAELEGKKKQAEEEEKAKEAEADSIKEESDPVICKVMVRLGALEEAVKEIVGEKKKTVDIKDQGASKKEPVTPASKKSDAQSEPKAGEAALDTSKKLVPPTGDPSDNNER